MSKNSVISIDLAKNVFQVCLLSPSNNVVFNKKVGRNKLLETVMQLDAKRIVMEACYNSNHWGRTFEQQGFTVDLIPPHQVKPFVVGNKNDHNDAIAIAEAALRPRATFVPVKSLEQQDIQSLDRIRDRLVKGRTAVANQLRGFLAEYGVVIDKKIAALRVEVPYVLEDAENNLTVASREFISELYDELVSFDDRIKVNESRVALLLAPNEDYQRLQSIPGIGPIVGRALICSVNDVRQFKNGRQMAAWIGLTPKQHASGEQSRMGGISKRGNRNLRRLLIHGARSVVNWCKKKTDPLSLWLQGLLKTKPVNKVVIALANKLVRIAWAVLCSGQEYRADFAKSA